MLKKIFVLLISQTMNGEFAYFVVASVLSSLVVCHIGNRAFTNTIKHS